MPLAACVAVYFDLEFKFPGIPAAPGRRAAPAF